MEPDIAPLAKRLAEENNVNWQHLQGSGANGRIVERDVLEYLARVMSGEEDLNPTPEPVPEGMQAWPEQDVKSFFGEQKNSSSPTIVQDFEADEDLLDVSDDLYDTKSFSDEELDFSAALPAAHASDDDKLDEDVFLFDDDLLNGDFSEAASSETIVEAESFEEVDMLLDDSSFEIETEQEDIFSTHDPFAEADDGFAFEGSFAEATSESESADFDTDALLLDDSDDLDFSAETTAATELLDDEIEDLPTSQQAAHEAADELFAVDLDEDLGFDEDVASLFVDAEDETAASFEEESLELESEDLLAVDEDDFAVDALNDLLSEDVLDDDDFLDESAQEVENVMAEEVVNAIRTDSVSETLSQDEDDLFVDSEAEALLEANDELFAFEEDSEDSLLATAEAQSDDSLFDFSEKESEAVSSEHLSFEAEQEVDATQPESSLKATESFVFEDEDDVEGLADTKTEDTELDFEANADEVLSLGEDTLQASQPEPEARAFAVTEEAEEALVAQTEVIDEVFEEDLLSEEINVRAEDRVPEPSPEVVQAEAELIAPIAVVAPVQSSPFMSFGLLLRRHVEASALQEACAIASDELQQESLDLTVFLLRAAAKAVGENIAYAKIQDNKIEVKQVKPSFDVSFRETWAALDKASPVQDVKQLTLIVANMSDLDIDEAVLNLPVPVLTLGRLHNGHMTLTLSGTIAAEKGSSLLAEIADLLAQPVRLLV